MNLVARGEQNKEIAALLHLTEPTIKEYLRRIFRKTGIASSRTKLAIWWLGRSRDELEKSHAGTNAKFSTQ